jgi:hypothetical protein
MKFHAGFLLILLTAFTSIAQPISDITQRNKERGQIQKSRIKSKSIIEYHYVKGDETALADSGYKSFYYAYDEQGRITEYTKYHVFTDLTLKEFYQYGKNDKITVNTRYNSRDDRIETITYKYNKKGQLKSQLHEAYYNTVRTGVYFSIGANINENELFLRVQKDLEIDPPLESYTIIVNVTDHEELNQYVVIGDESDPTSPRYSWSQLTMETQRDLLAYTGPNKKEHTYMSKFLSKVLYKYDADGNLTGREIYNTAGDMLEKESYRYDTENRRTGYTRYNEKGKAGSGEAYVYNAAGLLSESMGIEPDGKTSGRLLYKYNDANNITEKAWYNSAGEISGRFTYSYDNNNRLIEETRYRGEGEREFSFKYSYNELGDIADIIKYDVNNHKEKLIRYVYQYY